jgi:hypothetical protein
VIVLIQATMTVGNRLNLLVEALAFHLSAIPPLLAVAPSILVHDHQQHESTLRGLQEQRLWSHSRVGCLYAVNYFVPRTPCPPPMVSTTVSTLNELVTAMILVRAADRMVQLIEL